LIRCILIGVARSYVAHSVIKFFFEFCLQIVSQDIFQGGGGAKFTCGQLGCVDELPYEILLQQTRTKINKSL
jgi:hypothetical protein